MVHHTPKCSDEYKVIINLNLPHLESLMTCATDFISSLKKEFLRKVQHKDFTKQACLQKEICFPNMHIFVSAFIYV